MRVSPFGNLRISGYVRLPEAYRSLSRPSSAPDAKAFTMRPLQLDLRLFTMTYYFVNCKIYLFAYQSTAYCVNFLFPRTSLILNFAYLSFVIKTLYNHHKEYLFLACCILYTLIYVQFSKNIERHSLSKLNRINTHLITFEQVLYIVDAVHPILDKRHAYQISPQKGGDPAAGSPTATLLRLHPNR